MLRYLTLPAEQTPFEQAHLTKTNRIGLAFLWANVPLFMAVALFNQTGPLLALVLSTLVMAGPTVAWLTLPNRRHVSIGIGIAAMCMGGLLVHFGQGPMQIEMHFYFFSLLAVLAVYANPQVILAAATTVTLHHTVIWWLLPASVFNYDASFWVIGVHAAFVVVESIAAIYIARNLFDNVIGLERKVAERTTQLELANRSMRLVMQHVNQGLVTIDRRGDLSAERSARVDEWLGQRSSPSMVDYLKDVDPKAAEWFELGWQDLLDGFMPMEVTLEQLPRTVTRGEQQLRVDYIPIVDPTSEEDFEQLLVVMSDVTSEVARMEAEAGQRQLIQFVHHLLDDAGGVAEFLESGSEIVADLTTNPWPGDEVGKRLLHTLKGNAMSLDLDQLGEFIHRLEDRLNEEARGLRVEEGAELAERWQHLLDTADRLAPDQASGLRIEPHAIEQLIHWVQNGADPDRIVTHLKQLTEIPAQPRLDRLASQAQRIAERLGKGVIDVDVDAEGVRLPVDGLSDFWSSMVHVVRNAIDHGLESPEEREAAGKSARGRLTLRMQQTDDAWSLSVSDDGRGIDWDALRARGEALGLPHETEADLQALLFTDGVSSRSEATLTSGRGVGMSALAAAIHQHGGRIDIDTTSGAGTRFTFTLPRAALRSAA